MTIQTYKAIQGGYVPSDDGPVVFKTDYLGEIEHYQSDDRGKTNEINLLTKENRALTAALAEKDTAIDYALERIALLQKDIAALQAQLAEKGGTCWHEPASNFPRHCHKCGKVIPRDSKTGNIIRQTLTAQKEGV
jgi:hypothetical protein